MTRQHDLEKLIRESYRLILEYEGIRQLSPDPKEKVRCQNEIAEQWALIRGWLREYERVTSGAWPEDLRQVSRRFDQEGTRVAAAETAATAETTFFAYSHQDQDFALELAAELKRQGVPLWVDQWDIVAGKKWSKAINNALYDCGRFMTCIPHFVEGVRFGRTCLTAHWSSSTTA